MSDLPPNAVRQIAAHEFEREEHEHYVEPEWCSGRLFEEEQFERRIWDPCCGFGRIPDSARGEGLTVMATDIVDRGYLHMAGVVDFLKVEDSTTATNIVCNPPFDIFEDFARKALQIATHKVAMIWLVRRLNAARWLAQTPLARVWLLTPRPSMPPGHVIARGEKPGGGKQDFCWLVWDKSHVGGAEIKWLHRDAAS